jgi:hypothetical protein
VLWASSVWARIDLCSGLAAPGKVWRLVCPKAPTVNVAKHALRCTLCQRWREHPAGRPTTHTQEVVKDRYSFRKTKPATRLEWQGHAITSEWLLRVEEIGEGLRVRRSHAGHVVPAPNRFQAEIRTE